IRLLRHRVYPEHRRRTPRTSTGSLCGIVQLKKLRFKYTIDPLGSQENEVWRAPPSPMQS
ncbi:MAG TPA: hypothetical protein VFF49_06415, partial [Thermodesulfobacteriota bacterium]|nr:hypothetical protein [Thermodesulfobacteriota bacterium]